MPLNPNHPPWYSWLMLLLTAGGLSAVSFFGAYIVNERSAERDRQQQREVNAAFCDVVVTLDESGRNRPRPTTPYGAQLADNIRRLRERLECPLTPPAPALPLTPSPTQER